MESLPLEINLPDGRKVQTEVSVSEAFLGREPENEVQVDSEAVSRRHGRISRAGQLWFYQDLGSSNGSSVNGVKLPPEKRHLLRGGDLIKLGDTSVRIAQTDEANPASLIILIEGKFFREQRFTEQGVRVIFGGGGEFELPGSAAEDSIEVATLGGRLTLDNFSRGVSVTVNRHGVGGTVALHDRDEVIIGPYTVVVSIPGAKQPEPEAIASPVGSAASRGPQPQMGQYSVGGSQMSGLTSAGESDDPRTWRADLERRQAEKGNRPVLGSGFDASSGLTSREGAQVANTTGNRFSTGYNQPNSSKGESELQTTLTAGLGALVVLGGIGALIYWILF